MVQFKSFIADMDGGNEYAGQLISTTSTGGGGGGSPIGLLLALTGSSGGTVTTQTYSKPMVNLRWSDDRGHTWGDPVELPLGATGEYDSSLQWWGLGMARHRVFELSWAEDCNTALNGAWVDV